MGCNITPIEKEVYAVVKSIPRGRVATYGQVAAMVNKNRCARQIGAIMKNCKDKGVPCHRVVFSDGSLCLKGGFLLLDYQKNLLLEEGVVFKKSGKVDLRASIWKI